MHCPSLSVVTLQKLISSLSSISAGFSQWTHVEMATM